MQPEIEGRVQPGTTIKTDGLPTYVNLEEIGFEPEQLVTAQADDEDAAVEDLPWVHLLAANLQRVMEGVHTTYASGLLERCIALFLHRFRFRSDLWRGFLVGVGDLVQAGPVTWQQLKIGEKAGVRGSTETAS